MWGIDFGTTNSVVARWEPDGPRTVNLPALASVQPVSQAPVIPTAVYLLDSRGRRAFIGQKAIEENWDGQSPAFAASFKPFLGTESERPVARVGSARFTVRQVTRIFFQELFQALRERYGEAIRQVTIPSPVDNFEPYRAELQTCALRLGVQEFHSIDEPVAAAIGYGLNVHKALTLLVFDFGGGTLDLTVLRTEPTDDPDQIKAQVLAKQGLPLGGDHVDQWLMEELSPGVGPGYGEWHWNLKWEAERVKKQVSLTGSATFLMPGLEPRTYTVDDLVDLLTRHHFYRSIEEVLSQTLEEAAAKGVEKEQIEEVLLIGGSTLLPGVRTLLADEFGEERLRDWLPFEAVAHGACVYASGYPVQDFIHHDYALRVFNRETQQYEYPIIIPRGTVYPTPLDFVEKYFAPAQTRGEPQTEFELLIYEVGKSRGPQRRLVWAEDGSLRIEQVGRAGEPTLVCLNEANPTMGRLKPPGVGTAPRLRISFSVDADRWLCVTVHDLLRGVDLMVNQPVVRLR